MSERLLGPLLDEIARRSGLPLKLDAAGSCAIRYGAGFEMTLTEIGRGQGVLLHARIHRLSQANPLDELRRAMELNLHCADTGGATLGLEAASDWIVLSRRLSLANEDSHGLEREIVAFADVTRDLSGRLSEFVSSGDRATSPDPSNIIRA